MALDPREAPQLRGCGEEGKAEEEFCCLRGRSRKLQGCLPSTLIHLPAAGEARCGNDWDQGPGLEKRGERAKADHCPQAPYSGFSCAKQGTATIPTPAFGGFRKIREVCAFGCFFVCVWAFNSP